MNKVYYYLVVLAMICIGATLKFANSHEAMPIGCDEFGYLNLARTIDEGTISNRPFLNELLDTLRKEGITEPEINWMVTPHAYHILPGTNTVINQYPPGTSWLLSLFPFEWRNLLFPLLTMLLLIVVPVFVSRNQLFSQWNYFDLIFPAFLFLVTVSTPFTTEMARVNSLAVTFGLLVAAGMTLRNKPLLSCFLIALTVNFRIANVLMVMPVLCFLPFISLKTVYGRKQNVMLLLKFGCLTILAVLPLLIYNYQLLGNPIASTYSVIDTAVNESGNFLHNLVYYLSPEHHWLRVHAVVLVCLIICCLIAKMKWVDLAKTISFPLLNYLFFGWHSVTMDYYPYASAMIMTGMVFGVILTIKFPEKFRMAAPVTGVLIAVIVLIAGYNKYKKKEHITFEEAKAKYAVLCKYDVVWCDLFSGTTEYVCHNNGFRFATSTLRARKITLQYLSNHSYSQVIIQSDVPMEASVIDSEIQGSGLEYIRVFDKNLGALIVIPGTNSNNSSTH